jgi:hypothetical protein
MKAKGSPDSGPEGDRTNALVERLFQDAVGALELYTVYLGERLGLYRALAEGGPATSSELAERTGTAERYVREWLEHHASSGLLEVDDAGQEPLVRRYRLPPEHVPVLADPDDLRYEGYKGVDLVRAARPLPQLVEAFRTGDAPPPLPWEPEGRAEFNRARFLNLLGRSGFPRSQTSTGGFAPSLQHGSLTSRVARAGRASPWPRRTRGSSWIASTSTKTSSPSPARMPRRPALPIE